MKTKNLILLASAITLISGASLSAQRAGPPQGEGARLMPPLLAALDQDSDRTLSAEEIAAAAESLATLDENEDGELTPDEYRWQRRNRDEADRPDREARREQARRARDEGAPERTRPEGRRSRNPLMNALDTDGDRTISEEEIENASENLMELDANEDGVITMDELRPTRPERGGPGNRPAEARQAPASSEVSE